MEKLTLNYVGVDDWSRPVYKDEKGRLFKDVNCDEGKLALCTVCGGFDGEPDTPIEYIEKYQGADIEVIGKPEVPTPEERFNYQMLNRLQMDCEYYLGFGGRSERNLWALNVKDQIQKMKDLYNSFSDDKKPEWLTWDDILNYESEMGIKK